MPRPYSADLRERALVACERREGSRAEVARRFAVGVSTLHDWLRRQARQGRAAAARRR
jgi:transposase